MICPNCKEYFSNKLNLCPYCGTENLELKICYNCEFESYNKELMFCPECGRRLFNKKEYNKIKIKEENERKKEFRKIIDNTDLDSTSKLTLNHKTDLYLITNLRELDKEMSIEKRKKVLKTIVDNTNLESTTKSGLKYEINVGIIRNKDDLEKAFDIKKNQSKLRNLRKRKEKLRKIVVDSDLDSTTKSDLKNQINVGIIGSKYEIEKAVKKAIEKEKRKTELIKLIENEDNSNLDSTSKSSLKNQVKNDEITNNIELEKAIEKEKRKTEMRKIVFEASINHNSKIRLLSKIKLNKINKNELEEEINFEKWKIESKRKEKIRKKKLIEFAYNTNLSTKSKINLKNKINMGSIIDKEQLINEILKEEEREIILKEKKLEEELLKKEKEQYERILFAKINNSGLDENLQKRLRRNVKNGKIKNMERLNLEIKSLKKIHKIYF